MSQESYARVPASSPPPAMTVRAKATVEPHLVAVPNECSRLIDRLVEIRQRSRPDEDAARARAIVEDEVVRRGTMSAALAEGLVEA